MKLPDWIFALTLVAFQSSWLFAQAPRGIAPIVEYVDEQIQQGWEDNDVQPSAAADDSEWLRRAYLDIVGHIPSTDQLEAFLEDKQPNKRARVIDELLSHPDYVRNFTEIWTNVLIGRNTPERTSRSGLQKFLRESFARNRPWNEMVYELLTAEGHYEENGAVNFLLSQLQGNPNNDQYHVEATAKVTSIFLGMQVQCTQCHDHPFNDWKQNQFWEFNSFLQQVRRQNHDRYDQRSGRMVDDFSELVYREFDGPVYFERRNGLMQVAYPNYLGTEIDAKTGTRREELARLICHEDADQTMAQATVNRMWAHYLGYGFTNPIDDMGPHRPPSHPEILKRLADEFVASNYDLKHLSRIICNTQAYGLTSQFNSKNHFDDPNATGEAPLFSRRYVKTMQAEQLYDSLIIATNAHRSGVGNFEEAERQREQWLRDFLVAFGGNTDEEPTLFSGSIPQALLMMNGPLVQQAISGESGSYLRSVLANPRYRNDSARIHALYQAALGRNPERNELSQLLRIMRNNTDPLSAYQDLYWALLNSNEFLLNH